MDDLVSAVLENVVLAGVVKDFVKFEFPRLGLVVDDALVGVLWDAHSDSLKGKEGVKKEGILPN